MSSTMERERISLNGPAAEPAPVPTTGVTLTERAAVAVKRFVEDQRQQGMLKPDEPAYLRLSVKGGGCSGFQNKLDLDPLYNAEKDDLFEQHGVQIVIDRKSLLYIGGAVVDFHNDLNRPGFSITNPNAKTTCGCGSSYSV
ncbi:MAG TPA: iron-sulfur cluster assembly accessory protein [Gemmatales bacterium]|nr:iron-sulfur cluster assembly accessory protein [Gemmatales bacterium]HMP59031.1 iron-sulfur cluster assembly accessory protein [Gemmatales bacterium]